MKSAIQLIDSNTGEISACTRTLTIQSSSRRLCWDGILIEKGSCTSFYPVNIVSNDFLFILCVDEAFNWRARSDRNYQSLSTNPGEIWMNPPGIPFTHQLNASCSFIVLALSEKIITRNLDSKHKPLFSKSYNISDSTLLNLMMLIYQELGNPHPAGSGYVDCLADAFARHYIHQYSYLTDPVPKKHGLTLHDISKVSGYIHKHLEEPISIEELASLCNYSKYHFLREFRKITGITPHRYIMNVRMQTALAELQKNQRSMTQIAAHLGFSDQSHFIQTFKKYYGVAPGHFKKQKTADSKILQNKKQDFSIL